MPAGQIVITLPTWHLHLSKYTFFCLKVHIHVIESECMDIWCQCWWTEASAVKCSSILESYAATRDSLIYLSSIFFSLGLSERNSVCTERKHPLRSRPSTDSSAFSFSLGLEHSFLVTSGGWKWKYVNGGSWTYSLLQTFKDTFIHISNGVQVIIYKKKFHRLILTLFGYFVALSYTK